MVSEAELKRGTAPRCPACQLQLCKSRDEPPHAALKEMEASAGPTVKFGGTRDILYLCQTCGTVLVRSTDMAEAGWRQRR